MWVNGRFCAQKTLSESKLGVRSINLMIQLIGIDEVIDANDGWPIENESRNWLVDLICVTEPATILLLGLPRPYHGRDEAAVMAFRFSIYN